MDKKSFITLTLRRILWYFLGSNLGSYFSPREC